MAAEFLGVGWGFPVAREAGELRGELRFAHAAYEQSIEQSIRIILGTARGERVMRPDFGCGLQDLVFSVAGGATLGLAKLEVREALRRWEPRIDILAVTASLISPHENGIRISVDYRVRTTDNRFNLVYPFYLDRGVP